MHCLPEFKPFGTQRSWPDGSTVKNNEGNDKNRIQICDVSPSLPNCTVVGVVLTKEVPRSFPDKKNPGQLRFRLGLTIRDSPDQFINVTIWGSQGFVERASSTFRINDVVQIDNCKVQSKQNDEAESRFRVSTSSLFHLHVSENYGSVQLYCGREYSELLALTHLPMQGSEAPLSLKEIMDNFQHFQGQHATYLAIVKHVGKVVKSVSKTGRDLIRCEVKLFDETCPMLSLMLWDQEAIHFAQSWASKETILLVTDAKISFDEYRQRATSTYTTKTVVITNPDIRQAHALYRFALNVEIPEEEEEGASTYKSKPPKAIDLKDIQNVVPIGDWAKKVSDGHPETGISFGCITFANLSNPISYQCSLCERRADDEHRLCTNSQCSGYQGTTYVKAEFDFPVLLCDETGSLNCRMKSPIADQLLGLSPTAFTAHDDWSQSQLKWKFQLEWMKVYLQVGVTSQNRLMARILGCFPADPIEMKSM